MAKQKFSVLIGAVLAFTLVGGSVYVLFADDPQPVAIGTLHEFPEVSLEQIDGREKMKISGGGVKLVAFVSDECHTCHEAMDALITSEILNLDDFGIYYVWKDKPKSVPNSVQHEKIHNLILNERKLDNDTYGWSMTPRFYMLDAENKVIWDGLGFSDSIQVTMERKAEEA
ncbi:hypothetical protein CIG75_20390 [Tumebacillus algifaecis]|uniref:Thioredoxin domain-containing protein n=1 Tax=Tumebacillus algifaecis TaxID=1214604 RepID=A0A223D6B1_9BACL|nr:hypothetical protein [Tumebacillus algifaecis]ASS77027.1 hypothetical protein CIG75_20390 [Tumebacillus algifaecis]